MSSTSIVVVVALLGTACLWRERIVYVDRPGAAGSSAFEDGYSPPIISILKSEVLYEGKLVVTTASVLSPDAPWLVVIHPIKERLEAEIREHRQDSAHRTVVVEIVDNIDPAVLLEVLNTAWAAGFHPVVISGRGSRPARSQH